MNFLALIPVFNTLIERIFPDKKEAAEAAIKMQEALNNLEVKRLENKNVENEAKKDIITTEMKSQPWSGNWRSYMMLMCVAVVGYNWIIVSLFNAFLEPLGYPIKILPVPTELWTLITIGLSGYIGNEGMSIYTKAKYGKNLFDTIKQIKGRPLTQDDVDSINKTE